MIKGIHHVSIRCSGEEKRAEVIRFYRDLLGLPLVRQWPNGLMFNRFYNKCWGAEQPHPNIFIKL